MTEFLIALPASSASTYYGRLFDQMVVVEVGALDLPMERAQAYFTKLPSEGDTGSSATDRRHGRINRLER